jgi:hypothetical protein
MPMFTALAAPADLMCRCGGWSWSWLVPLRKRDVGTSNVMTPSGLHLRQTGQAWGQSGSALQSPAALCIYTDCTQACTCAGVGSVRLSTAIASRIVHVQGYTDFTQACTCASVGSVRLVTAIASRIVHVYRLDTGLHLRRRGGQSGSALQSPAELCMYTERLYTSAAPV